LPLEKSLFLGRVSELPMKYILKIFYCTIIGGIVILLINFVGDKISFHIPFNIISSAIVGLLGIPGLALLVVLKILFNA
jgi:inhibitor of the pro-sigma K processing machinery